MMFCGAARVAHPPRIFVEWSCRGSASTTCYMKGFFLELQVCSSLPCLGLLNNKHNDPNDDKVSSS